MATQYSASQGKDYRRFRPEVVVSVIVIIILLVGVAYLYWESRRNPTTVDNSGNEAVLGVFELEGEPWKTVYEDDFSVYIPENWRRINDPEIRVSGSRYFPIRYEGTEGYHVGRRLDVYVGNAPRNLPVNKVLTVDILQESFMEPQDISPQCTSFTDFDIGIKGAAIDTIWEGHVFTCETSFQDNSVATVYEDYNDFVELVAPDGGVEKVVLVFTDHGGRPDNTIFNDIVTNFRLR